MHLFTFENYLFRRHIAIESCNRSFYVQRGKCSKAKNARGAREIAFVAFFFFFYLATHLLNASQKKTKKNRQHFHHPTAYYYSRESKSRWYATVSITLPVCIDHRSLNVGVRNACRPGNDEFSLVYRKLLHLSAGDRDL